MDLENIKQLEKLKQQRSQLSQKKSRLISQKIDNFKLSIIDEFKHYFKDKGFEVTDLSSGKLTKITASYLNAVAEFTCDNKPIMGADERFFLKLNMGNNKTYTILLNTNTPGAKSKWDKSYSNPDEKLIADISNTKEDIEKLEITISNIDDIQPYLFILEFRNQKFNSMTEVLDFLIK